ncbi:DMSO/TMAO reductase YedYZ molybdopterin-dependent catalytic subunit [Catenuloplanes nepalensis]|uniref:DMSO/TMAO reductase YedYZ molybdopterin-dependent catalytic subunit n=1 Tax=Catenuloplanes nepalensis TaxID=587533 RepID=A0ABT9MR66_9ACTN|nr:molybdopterin-dependent oxidoreductase [Catenuloplanes nepalensis]MDP9793905.1 DMSO/TMAO reductase YedYZ molybdopterin-dependent catalytic subunit [Catenuloplanes nepalensis]
MRSPANLFSGLIAAGAGVAAGELLAAAARPGASPVLSVGAAVIDATPTPVKEFAVRTAGTADKPLLLTGIVLLTALLAAGLGVAAARRPLWGILGFAVFGLAGALAAATRPDAGAMDALPSLLAGLVAAVTLTALTALRPAGDRTIRKTDDHLAGTPNAPEHGDSALSGGRAGAHAPDGNQVSAHAPDGNQVSAHAPDDSQVSAHAPDGNQVSAHAPDGNQVSAHAPDGNQVSAHAPDGRLAGARVPDGSQVSARVPGGDRPGEPVPESDGAGSTRRAFVVTAGLVAGGAAVAGGVTGVLRRRASVSVAESRAAVRLPVPGEAAPPLPPGTPADFVTANADFYRVDTALTLPRIDPDAWRLRIHGMVGNPVTLSLGELLARRTVERFMTLTCVSNEVGGPYTGTARWLGVPLKDLLDDAGVDAGADQLVARGADGMTIGTPTRVIMDGRDAMLAVGMNGEPLPVTHGFPVRMLTPGLYGYAGSCKWITELELTTFARYDAYWVARGWAAEGPAKTASRIDRPAPFARLASGTEVTISGVAWALHTGIAGVEVQVDDGAWQAATVLPPPSGDTWVQWRLPWTPAPGGHTLRVRATDRTGAVQTDARATPFPDGATGRHTISVSAS